jgi:hypothetical protein
LFIKKKRRTPKPPRDRGGPLQQNYDLQRNACGHADRGGPTGWSRWATAHPKPGPPRPHPTPAIRLPMFGLAIRLPMFGLPIPVFHDTRTNEQIGSHSFGVPTSISTKHLRSRLGTSVQRIHEQDCDADAASRPCLQLLAPAVASTSPNASHRRDTSSARRHA